MRNSINRAVPIALTVAMSALFAVGCASTQPDGATTSAESQAAEAKSAAQTPAATPASMMASYNVVRGDHLWGISSKSTIYGNPYQWPLIFKANRDKIRDADLIEVGQVLSIDKNPTSYDVSSAVEHARTRGAWSLGSTEKSDLSYLAGYGMK